MVDWELVLRVVLGAIGVCGLGVLIGVLAAVALDRKADEPLMDLDWAQDMDPATEPLIAWPSFMERSACCDECGERKTLRGLTVKAFGPGPLVYRCLGRCEPQAAPTVDSVPALKAWRG